MAGPDVPITENAVLTHQDVPGVNRYGLGRPDQPVLADGVVRYQGEPVALVAADHPETARSLLPWLRHKREWRQVQTAASQMLHEVPGDSPERWPWLAYRAEAALALGDRAAARADLSALALSPHAVWQNRARQLTTIQQRGAQ